MLTQAIDILSPLQHQDISIGQNVKYLHYERLLLDLTESITKQTFLDNENNLWEKCQSFLKENHSDNGKYLLFIEKHIIIPLFPNPMSS